MPFPLFRRIVAPVLLAALLASCAVPAPRPQAAATQQASSAPPPAAAAPPTHASANQQPVPRGPLGQRIAAFLSAPRFAGAEWGIDVVEADSGRVLYSHQSQKLFVPASNAKLYTAALALDVLGPDARFRTSLYASTQPGAAGILAGDLILHGGGDPSLGDSAVAADNAYWIEQFANTVAASGIRRVTGSIVADDTLFAGPAFSSSWEVGDLGASYAPRVSALTSDGNLMLVEVNRDQGHCCRVAVEPQSAVDVVNLTHDPRGDDPGLLLHRPAGSFRLFVGGSLPESSPGRRFTVPVPDPALLAAKRLRAALLARGVQVDDPARARHWPMPGMLSGDETMVAQTVSPPLRDLIVHMLKHSDNLYAQTLLLDVGVATARQGQCRDRERTPGTTEGWAQCAMRALLGRIGIDHDQAYLAEGSGLSRHDLVAPAATTSLLMWVRRQQFAGDFLFALPVAGEDGTLAWRLANGPASHQLRAKTGTLSHVSALSGYVANAAGEQLVFAIYLNRYLRPRDALGRALPPSPRDDVDAIARMIAESGNGSAGNLPPMR